jgi:hypothetical protein
MKRESTSDLSGMFIVISVVAVLAWLLFLHH